MLDRRRFLAATAAAAALPDGHATQQGKPTICAFVKPFQKLEHARVAEIVAELGFDGIEATVRPGGQVLPERVDDDLPKLVEALTERRLEVTVMASSINRADKASEKVLRAAAALGVERYRMAYYHYDLRKPVRRQLDALQGVVRDLAALNREIGISAIYQNHAGARNVGAPVWDLHQLLGEISPDEIGVAFDIRHATVEGGLAWPLHWNATRERVRVLYAKDFRWEGRKVRNVPLGDGQVDPKFFAQARRDAFAGPISLHVEYLERAGEAKNIPAFRDDLATLRKWLAA